MKPPEVLVLWATGDDADALARAAVGQVLDVDPRTVVVGRRCPECASTEHGAPTAEGASVSVSRTPGLVVVAASTTGPVGVDVERTTDSLFDGFDDVALAPSEAAALDPDDARGRLRAWVRKEAVLKACGRGLAIDPRLVVLTPAGQIAEAPPIVGRPAVWDIDLGTAYAACAAPVGADVRVEAALTS